jgi:uncharacterized small protein (DUF1192 family)
MFDEMDLPKPKRTFTLGDKLETYSISELDDLIGLLQAEIARAEADKDKKKKSAEAAAALFKV